MTWIRIGESAAEVEAKLRELGFKVNAIEVDGVGVEPTKAPVPTAPAAAEPVTAAVDPVRRHAWVRIKDHTDMCERCATGRVHEQEGREHFSVWHLPTGWSGRMPRTPPCEPGPRTESWLRKYAAAIAEGKAEKKGKKAK